MLRNGDLENVHRGLQKGVVRAAHPRTTNIRECPPPPGPYVRVHELSSVRVVFGNCLLARESYVCAMLSTLLPLWNVGNVCAGKRNADAQEIPHIRAIHMTYRHIFVGNGKRTPYSCPSTGHPHFVGNVALATGKTIPHSSIHIIGGNVGIKLEDHIIAGK